MKEKKPFIIQFAIGIILAAVGLATEFDYYSNLIFAMGCGVASSSAIQLIRIIYWNSPKRHLKYQEKKKDEHINLVDERKQFLRMKAGHITYQIMAFAMLMLSFILTLFRAEAWVIATMFLLFIAQWALGMIVYHILEKRM